MFRTVLKTVPIGQARVLWNRVVYKAIKCTCGCSIYPKMLIAQSVKRLATGWSFRESNPGGGARFFAPFQTGPGDYPTSLANGYRVFSGGKAAVVWLWPPNPFYRRSWRKSRAIHLLPIWAFVACSRVTFTFTFAFTSTCNCSPKQLLDLYEVWNFNSGNYLFTTDTK